MGQDDGADPDARVVLDLDELRVGGVDVHVVPEVHVVADLHALGALGPDAEGVRGHVLRREVEQILHGRAWLLWAEGGRRGLEQAKARAPPGGTDCHQ